MYITFRVEYFLAEIVPVPSGLTLFSFMEKRTPKCDRLDPGSIHSIPTTTFSEFVLSLFELKNFDKVRATMEKVALFNRPYKYIQRSGNKFLWVAQPALVISKIAALLDSEKPILISEEGAALTGRQFLQEVIAFCPVWPLEFVGVEFS